MPPKECPKPECVQCRQHRDELWSIIEELMLVDEHKYDHAHKKLARITGQLADERKKAVA